MKKIGSYYTVLLFFLFAIINCNDSELSFSTVDHQLQFIKINTIREGSVLVSDTPITIKFTFDDDIEMVPDEVVVQTTPYNEEKQNSSLSLERYLHVKAHDNFYRQEELPFVDEAQEAVALYSKETLSPNTGALRDNNGNDVEVKENKSQEEEKAGYALSYLVPRMDNGLYDLSIEFFANRKSLGKKNIPFFFAQEIVGFSSIEVQPGVAYPDGEVLLLLTYDKNLTGNEYVRIYLKDKLIKADYAYKIGEKYVIKAPQVEGVYPLQLEIYPFTPKAVGVSNEEFEAFDFSSALSIKTDLFVSVNQSSFVNDLTNSNSYSMLYHFKGELNDWASGSAVKMANVVGSPLLDINEGFFGYRFNSRNYLHFSNFALPLKNGSLQPFSIHISTFMPEAIVSPLFTTHCEGFSFALYGKENRLPALTITKNEKKFESAVPMQFKPSDFAFKPLTLSFYSEKNGSWVLWYKDGNFVHKDYLPVVFNSLTQEGDSYIGYNQQFAKRVGLAKSAIIDEFGIYYKNDKGEASIDSEVFNQAMSRRLKTRLLFCEGFDRISLAQLPFLHEGKMETKASSLFMHSNSSIQTQLDCSALQRVNIAIGLHANGSKSAVSIVSKKGKNSDNLLLVDFIEETVSINGRVVAFVKQDGLLQISFIRQEDFFGIAIDQKRFPLDERNMLDVIDIVIKNQDEKLPFIIDEVLIDSLDWPQKLIENKTPIIYWDK